PAPRLRGGGPGGRAGGRPARPPPVTTALRLGVLASGVGSNLRNLVDRGYRVAAVATNRPGCGAAAIARERGLPLGEFSQRDFRAADERDAATRDWLLEREVGPVGNAGYDRG